jgi:hypothetical protein
MRAKSADAGNQRFDFLEALSVAVTSAIGGLVIGTLQHYLGLGVWGYGFGKQAFELACLEGGVVGCFVGMPTGLIGYYAVMKARATNKQIVLVVLGTLIGGCVAGLAAATLSVFVTPILTLLLCARIKHSTTPGASSELNTT